MDQTLIRVQLALSGQDMSCSPCPKTTLPEPRFKTKSIKIGSNNNMAAVITKFFIASIVMWIVPIAILLGFNHKLLPGSTEMSPYSKTLLSGFLAVLSVNIVIFFYIYMALKEPSDKHEPDPAFVAEAKASVNQSTDKAESSSESLKKQE
ncbi:hypothetical protein Q3G72_031462 [Acer saccharum]|nr:hypothetical protein Q3G72_031462 [Acer saccharum]